uniref:Uncharacterized protein n=1 Tax=Phasianus colchicus TaxID=9054 RepID=A0A669Q7U2_PHACC
MRGAAPCQAGPPPAPIPTRCGCPVHPTAPGVEQGRAVAPRTMGDCPKSKQGTKAALWGSAGTPPPVCLGHNGAGEGSLCLPLPAVSPDPCRTHRDGWLHTLQHDAVPRPVLSPLGACPTRQQRKGLSE